jgi:hypothetical protein
MLRANRGYEGGRFPDHWFVMGPSGYLWPDGVFRILCWDGPQDGEGGYYPAKELAESAALNHKAAHSPEAARRAEPC